MDQELFTVGDRVRVDCPDGQTAIGTVDRIIDGGERLQVSGDDGLIYQGPSSCATKLPDSFSVGTRVHIQFPDGGTVDGSIIADPVPDGSGNIRVKGDDGILYDSLPRYVTKGQQKLTTTLDHLALLRSVRGNGPFGAACRWAAQEIDRLREIEAKHSPAPAEVATLAKYFVRRETCTDGKTSVETVGFQTHRELMEFMIATEPSEKRTRSMARLIRSYKSNEEAMEQAWRESGRASAPTIVGGLGGNDGKYPERAAAVAEHYKIDVTAMDFGEVMRLYNEIPKPSC